MTLLDRLIDWLIELQPNRRRPPHRRVPEELWVGSIYVPVEDYMTSLEARVFPYSNPIFELPTRREVLAYQRAERAERAERRTAREAARRAARDEANRVVRVSEELWGA